MDLLICEASTKHVYLAENLCSSVKRVFPVSPVQTRCTSTHHGLNTEIPYWCMRRTLNGPATTWLLSLLAVIRRHRVCSKQKKTDVRFRITRYSRRARWYHFEYYLGKPSARIFQQGSSPFVIPLNSLHF